MNHAHKLAAEKRRTNRIRLSAKRVIESLFLKRMLKAMQHYSSTAGLDQFKRYMPHRQGEV